MHLSPVLRPEPSGRYLALMGKFTSQKMANRHMGAFSLLFRGLVLETSPAHHWEEARILWGRDNTVGEGSLKGQLGQKDS